MKILGPSSNYPSYLLNVPPSTATVNHYQSNVNANVQGQSYSNGTNFTAFPPPNYQMPYQQFAPAPGPESEYKVGKQN